MHLKTQATKRNSLPRIPSVTAGRSSVLRNFANIYIPGCSESSSRPFFDLARQVCVDYAPLFSVKTQRTTWVVL